MVGLILSLLSAAPLAAQSEVPSPRGLTYGISVGVSRVALDAIASGSAVRSTNLAIGWQVGWQLTDRAAVLLAATSSAYASPHGPGGRTRGFETITPTVEYRVADGLRLQAGAGLQLDAPVFWDSAPLNAGERRFSRGLGLVLGASYAPRHRGTLAPELRTRWNTGFADIPAGRLRGSTTALLLGVRHDPR
jgi:hypothetical protein